MKKVYKRFTNKELWDIVQSQTLRIMELKHKIDMYEVQELIDRANKLLEKMKSE